MRLANSSGVVGDEEVLAALRGPDPRRRSSWRRPACGGRWLRGSSTWSHFRSEAGRRPVSARSSSGFISEPADDADPRGVVEDHDRSRRDPRPA